jgi:dihydropteroate synthase
VAVEDGLMKWTHARGELELERCLVMGIINRTPDSFYDGGRMDPAEVLAHGDRLLDEGADILDIGAVKAGPGTPVSEDEESARLLPVVEALAETGAILSVETARPPVARAAVEAGAAIVNDVSGIADPGLTEVCASTGAGLIVMHHGGQIRGRPRHPRYENVVADVVSSWEEMVATATGAGVDRSAIVVDPGLDFGKTTLHSLELVRRLPELAEFGSPVLVAASRKDVVGETLALPPSERLEGSLALVALSVWLGAAAVRVHDVRASVRVTRMIESVRGDRAPEAAIRGLWD